MKRQLFFLFLSLCIKLSAEVVPQDVAYGIAMRFVDESVAITKSGNIHLSLVWDGLQGEDNTKGVDAAPPLYVYNIEPGSAFVIVSGDTRCQPLLAYSTSNSFSVDNAPHSVRYWLDRMVKYIEHQRSEESGYNPSVEEWQQHVSMDATSTNTILLPTAEWDQSKPYNRRAPDGAYAGCVATAMAIIMKYYEWPDRGEGVIDSYSYTNAQGESVTIKGHELGYDYNWKLMPNSLNKVYDDNVIDQVAQLIYDCGVMIKSQYGRTGTAAYSSSVVDAICRYMKYDESAYITYSYYYTDTEWKDLLRENIKSGAPALYSAVEDGVNVGHAFVLDGYDEQGRFHINFGWGGYNNGYYLYPSFAEYTTYHDAIFNFFPDRGGQIVPALSLGSQITITTENSALVSVPKTDTPYLLNAALLSVTSRSYVGNVAIFKCRKDGTPEEVLNDTIKVYNIHSVVSREPEFYDIEINIKTPIKIGDHLRYYYRDENEEWKLFQRVGDRVEWYYLTDRYFLREVTKADYDVKSRVLTIKTKSKAVCRLYNVEGEEVEPALENNLGEIVIERDRFAPGLYKLHLSTTDEDSFEFEILF